MKLGERYKRMIGEAMAGLSGASARRTAEGLAAKFNVSTSTVYRVSRELRGNRKSRSDSSKPRHGASEQALEKAWALMYNLGYSADRALEILEFNGLVAPGQMSAATLRRELLRIHGMGCRDLARMRPSKIKPVRPQQTVHYSYEADYPNQVWQIDFTVAEQFYVKDDDKLGYQSPLAHRKNARNPKGNQLWIYAVTDMYSRCRFTRAYPGMDSTYVLDFLFESFRKKDDWPWDFAFYGVPDLLQGDGDSRLEAKITRRACELISMELRTIKANPNAQGMVERGFHSRKDVQNATRIGKLGLDEFNLLLLDDDLRYNWRDHSSTSEKPFSRFMRDVDRVRVLPDRDLWDALMYDELYLYINPDLHYRIQGEQYQLPDVSPFNEMARRKVVMKWGRRTAEKVTVVWKGVEYEAPIMKRRFYPIKGEHPYVPRKNEVERMLERAAGDDCSDLKLWGHHLKKHENVAILFRPEEESVKLPESAPVVKPMAQAIEEVRNRTVGPYGFLAPAWGAYLKEKFKEGATAADIEEAVETIKAELVTAEA